jgi:hypothetical protein
VAFPTRWQLRTNLLILPPVSRVHRGVNLPPVIAEMPLRGIGEMVLYAGCRSSHREHSRISRE